MKGLWFDVCRFTFVVCRSHHSYDICKYNDCTVWSDFLILGSYAYPVQNCIGLFKPSAVGRCCPYMGGIH